MLHCEEDEPVTTPVSRFDFEFEREVINMRVFKELLYEEILLQHFPEKVRQYQDSRAAYETNLEEIINKAKEEDPDMEEENLDEDEDI
jgi:hypothetical protein